MGHYQILALISLVGAIIAASALVSLFWAFNNCLWGVVPNAFFTGITTPLPLLAIALYAYPQLFLSRANCFGWILPFALHVVGYYIYYDAHRPGSTMPPEIVACRWILYVGTWSLPYCLCFRKVIPKTISSTRAEQEFALCEQCQMAYQYEHECPATIAKLSHPGNNSGLWVPYVALLSLSFSLKLVGDFFPDTLISTAGSALGILGVLIAACSIRNKDIEYDIPSLFFYVWSGAGVAISLADIGRLGSSVAPAVGSIAVTIWGAALIHVTKAFFSRVSTKEDFFLFLFPVYFMIDLTQAMFFVGETVSIYTLSFWSLVIVQEAWSLFGNTGLRYWCLHKCFLRCGKATDADNPYVNPEVFAAIHNRARVDTLSEQLSILAVFVAILGADYSRQWGASLSDKVDWFGKDTWHVLVRLLVVAAIRIGVFIFEKIVMWRVANRLHSNTSEHHQLTVRGCVLGIVLVVCGVFKVLTSRM